MSLNIYYSNHLDSLQYISGHIIQNYPLENPFEKEYFLVQNFGMARWMQIKLASQLGILTQAEFLLPSKMLSNLLEILFEGKRPEKLTLDSKKEAYFEHDSVVKLSQDQLYWPLVKIINDERKSTTPNPLLTPIYDYIHAPTEEEAISKIMGLAQELAAIFDKYIVYRHDWINAWSEGKEAPPEPFEDAQIPKNFEIWQAELWRLLYNAIGKPLHFGNIQPLIQERLKNPKITQKLPKRLFIIGLNSLPPLFLELLAQFSEVLDIHLFFNNPSQYYWGDLTRNAAFPRIELKNFERQAPADFDPISPYAPKNPDELWQNSYGNPLLASLGKVGRDHLYLIQQYDEERFGYNVTEAFAAPEERHLLGKIQSEIFHLRPLSESEPYILDPKDRSVQIHRVYSPMREVEALYDQLLHLFNQDPELRPSDIVVMTPKIEEYAPLIHALFGNAPKERYIPYSISDVSLKESEPIFEGIISLLNLPESQFKANDLIALLQIPEMMERFELDEHQLNLIRFWIQDSDIRQGLDGEHLQTLHAEEEPHNPQNTHGEKSSDFDWHINSWRWGLERMLLGYATAESPLLYPSTESKRVDALAPYPHIEGLDALIIGKLCHFLDLLAKWHQRLNGAKKVADWWPILAEIWHDFFLPTPENSEKLAFVLRFWQEILEGGIGIGFEEEIPLKNIASLLEFKLLEEKPDQNFIQGKVTFCSFIPMRAIPFKVVAMIGLNQADFPTTANYHNFDLMQYSHRRGDRTRNSDDRYLFLEAIISAKEYLYLSYIGRSIIDNTELFPSLLIDEFCRYIEDLATTQEGDSPLKLITTDHPMAAYNPQLFQPGTALQTFQNEWLNLKEVSTHYESPYSREKLIQHFNESPEFKNISEIHLHDLIRFYEDPITYFAQSRLDIRLFNIDDATLNDDEAFIIANGLDKYQFHHDITAKILTHKTETGLTHSSSLTLLEEELYPHYRLQGKLPKFAFSKIAWDEVTKLPITLTETLFNAGYSDPQFIDTLFLPPLKSEEALPVRGRIPAPNNGNNILLWEAGKLNHKRQVRAAFINLFYHATKPIEEETHVETHLYTAPDKGPEPLLTRFPHYSSAEAKVILLHLIGGYLEGIKAPFIGTPEAIYEDKGFKRALESCLENPSLASLFNLEDNPATIPWQHHKMHEILTKDPELLSQLEPIRNHLNKVESLFGKREIERRLFPNIGPQESFAYLLFYHHYLTLLIAQ